MTGLDAGSARIVKEVLRERVRRGDTVIMTTHILEVAERMADRIGVMRTAASSPKARSTIAPTGGHGDSSLEDRSSP